MPFLREMKRTDKHGRPYSYWVAVKTYREKKTGKVKHQVVQTFGRLTHDQAGQIRQFQALKEMGKNAVITSWQDIQVGQSYEYLTVRVLDHLYRLWGLDRVLNTNKNAGLVSLSDMAEVLILNRALCPNSDYKVSGWYQTTVLPQILKVAPSLVNPTRIYRSLDDLVEKEELVQTHLAEKVVELGLDTLSLILYDLTSTYFEGYECPLAQFGLSRDHRKDRPQVLLALAVTKEGFPVYWRVLSGQIHDSATVAETVTALKEKFHLSKVCMVMDKGMVNQENFREMGAKDMYYLVTIPRPSFRRLSSFPAKTVVTLGRRIEEEMKKEEPDYQSVMKQFLYFTYHSRRAYFHLLEEPDTTCRYVLCFNPEKCAEERRQRAEKMTSIERVFERWNQRLLRARTTRHKRQLEQQLYAYLDKRKAHNLFRVSMRAMKTSAVAGHSARTTYQLRWRPNVATLKRAQLTDGCYCLKTNLPKDIAPAVLVSSYRQRQNVEVAFHYLKGFVEIRPVYHYRETRVKAHITVCILAYLLQVTVEQMLKKTGLNLSFREFLSRIASRRAVDLRVSTTGKEKMKLPEVPKEITALLQAVKFAEC